MATILVVEDEALFRELYSNFLSRHKHKVLLAANADEALIKIRDFKPDLIVTDLKMPRRSGVELLEELADVAPETPVIVCSALYAMREEVTFFHGERKFAFHEKPVNLEKLLADINSLLPPETC